MIRCYCRGSTSRQGLTLEAQRERLSAWATYQGHSEVAWYCELESSSLEESRPESARMLAEVRRGDTIVVAKLDRLSRSVREFSGLLARFKSAGIDLVVLDCNIDTSNATGRLIAHVLISLAQWEKEVISERTVAALGHLRSQGDKLGQAPYGWRKVDREGRSCDDRCACGRHDAAAHGRLVALAEDQEEQKALLQIMLRVEEGCTQDEICAYLNQAGIRSRGGKLWHRRTVQEIMRRAREGKEE